MPTIGIDACLTTTPHWYDKCSEKCGRTLSCYSVALCCCTNGRTWACMISSRYLMPVSVPSTTTIAVLPRDEMPPHTMTLPPPYGRRSITQLVMETFTNKTVHSGTAVAVVEIDSSMKRIHAQSCCVKCMCLLHHPNRATRWRCCRTGRMAGRRGRMPRSRNRLLNVRGLILLRLGILLAVKEAVLSRSRRWTTRMYVSLRIDVTRGCPDRCRFLVAPNCWWRLHYFGESQIVWQRQYDVHQLQSSLWRGICQFHSTLAWRISDVFQNCPAFVSYM